MGKLTTVVQSRGDERRKETIMGVLDRLFFPQAGDSQRRCFAKGTLFAVPFLVALVILLTTIALLAN